MQQSPSFLHRSIIARLLAKASNIAGANLSKIATEENKVLGVLQNQCFGVPQQD
jgi:hypothetical protein